MSCKGNWVCFSCRITTRRETWNRVTVRNPELIGSTGSVKCRECREPMKFLGPSIKVPAKKKVKAWKDLEKRIQEFRLRLAEAEAKDNIASKHRLEKRIFSLQRRSYNRERRRLITDYNKKLTKFI